MLYMGHRFNPDRVSCVGKEPDDTFRRMHFDICQGINLTRLSCVLAKMEEQGTPKETIAQFKAMASALLGLMVTENNRNHGY